MDVKYTAVYRGENAPRRTDVLWVHHSVKNDLTSPIVVQSFSKGRWVDAYDKEDQSDIERLTEQLGDITTLETTAQNSVVSAINEVVGNTGDLDDLTTTEKTTLVGAINEAATSGDPASLLYTAQTLTDAQQAQARANVGAASEAELQALNSGEVVPVASLPTASADTMGKVYLVGPDANSEYDRYVSSYDGTDYTWVQIGTTEMDLSGYATDAELSELEHEVTELTGGAIEQELTWTTGKRVSLSNGSDSKIINATSIYSISNYIEVESANWKLRVAGVYGLSSIETPAVNYYDAEHKHIGYVYIDGSGELTIPSGVKYVLISQVDTANYPTSGVSVKFVLPPSIVTKTEFDALEDRVEDIEEELQEMVGDEVTATLTWTNEKRVSLSDSSDSKIVNASSDYSVSNYIEVPGIQYKLLVAGVHGASNVGTPAVNYYDSTQKHIGYVYIDGSAELTIPSGVSYVLISQVLVGTYPTSGVSVKFKLESEFATREDIEAVQESVSALGDVKSVLATNDDIDTISYPGFKIDGNGNLVTTSQITAGATAFMLFKDNIKAIEFTINASWGYGADFCFGYGYKGQDLCNVVIPTIGTYKGYIISKGADGSGTGLDTNASAIGAFGRGLQAGRMFQKMTDVTIGDRCMMEIVCDKYICCYVWKNNKWEDWFMIFPTDLWSFCNIQNDGVRLRYGWNERFGLGVSVPNYNLAGGTTLLTNVRILSKTNSHLFDYHNSVTMRRGKMLKKNWLILGDSLASINADNGWGFVGFAERRSLYNAINLGVSGMYLAGIWRQKADIGWEAEVSSLEMGDVVTIEGGGNDFIREGDTGVLITLENPNDKYDDTTTLGCLRLIIERIIELNPYVSINVITNQYTDSFVDDTNLAGHTMSYFYGKICEVAEEYHLPHLELFDRSVANKFNIEALSYDDIHPNQIGSEIIGEMVAKELL